jgi:hypothetical protein
MGFQLPPLRSDTLTLSPGDTLIMATDGIRTAFSQGIAIDRRPSEIAGSLLRRFAKGGDDARVVVARYVGPRRRS